MNPRLVLISPRNAFIKTTRRRQLAHLGLPVVAALTPANWSVRILDDLHEPVEGASLEADLVGISMFTAQAQRGYEIGDQLARRGIPVVYGGIHASSLPDEALQHGTSVVVGEAEGAWEKLCADFEAGRPLASRYVAPVREDFNYAVQPRTDLLKTKTAFGMVGIQTTRGCPYTCDFCTVHRFFQNTYRHRPIEQVVEEIRRSGAKRVLFIDDHIMGHAAWAKQLFEALIPLKIKWGGQSTLLAARDLELIRLARRSGCFSMFVGVESISQDTLDGINKGFNHTDRYVELIRNYQRNGISIVAGTIFGFDTDGPDVFHKTVAFYDRVGMAVPNYGLLTPFPGTELFTRMQAEGRLLHTNWGEYTGNRVVFRPARMSGETLQRGVWWAAQRTYAPPSIAWRLRETWRTPLFTLATNVSFAMKSYAYPLGRADRVPRDELDGFLAKFERGEVVGRSGQLVKRKRARRVAGAQPQGIAEAMGEPSSTE